MITQMNPFMAFCLYVAARVFVQYLKSRPDEEHIRSSLQFLLRAMQALKRKNPLTESFLVQLDVDLEGAGMDDPRNASKFAYILRKNTVSPIIHILPSFGNLTNGVSGTSRRWRAPQPFNHRFAKSGPGGRRVRSEQLQSTECPPPIQHFQRYHA